MMWPTRKNRFRSGLDTTSTADISFVLLIFFLVTTSMDIDKGLVRELSPMEPEEEQVEEQEVDANGMMELRIQADGRLLVDGEEQTVQAAGKKMEAFLERRGSNHVIVLGAHPQAAYDRFVEILNALLAGEEIPSNNVINPQNDRLMTLALKSVLTRMDAAQLLTAMQKVAQPAPLENN